MTLMELQTWALNRHWSERRRLTLHDKLQKSFTIYHSYEALCRACAEVAHYSIRKGRRMRDGDAWIAATAYALDLPLISHNKKDFEHLDMIQLISAA